MADEVERRVLETVWPVECESIGEEALISILTSDQDLKEVDLKGGDNFDIDDIYKILTASLGIIKQLKAQFKDFVSSGGKPDEFTVTDGKRKLTIVASSPAIRAVVAEQVPTIIEAFCAASNKPK
jgi:hypothetical protein